MPTVHLLERVREVLVELPQSDQEIISGNVELLRTRETEMLVIKTLRGPIKELVMDQYRMIFFRKQGNIYCVTLFKKQSKKTPQRFIKHAEKIYKLIT